MKTGTEIRIKFDVALEKDKQGFVAREKSLGLYGIGETASKAIKSLEASIDITIEHCLENGTLSNILKEAGFTKKRIRSSKTKKVVPLNYSFPIEHGQRLHA